MYDVAERKINEGLSLFPRLLLALCSTVFGLVMIFVAPPTSKALPFYAFAGLCFLIAVACVVQGRARQFAGSLIGSALFAMTLGYASYEIWNGPTLSVSRTEPSALTSIICFLAFGLPGAKYVWTAKFGLIRRGPATEGIK